ncbi:MAG: TlpA disulfide reductase family protein [Planctomycetota bacterium]|nr:TlpA disulfide reductase family protein [Planctomycetota bacterium]
MKWASGLIAFALILAVSAPFVWSSEAPAGGGSVDKDLAKALDKATAELAKFAKKHPDSDQAKGIRTLLASIYTKQAPKAWVEKNMKNAKALLADLDKHEERSATSLRDVVHGIELPGNPPPEINVKDTAGNVVTLGDYKGKVLLIDFWATWCGPCIGELPGLKAIYNDYKDKGFDILGISLDRDLNKLKNFVDVEEMAWRQIFDKTDIENPEEGKPSFKYVLAQRYGVPGIPKTYLIDRDGNVVHIGLRAEGLREAVEKLIGGKAEM